jgi:hypothetical protein
MHNKYAKEGLVVLSVTLDEDPEVPRRVKALKKTDEFLASLKPPFPTYDVEYDRDKPLAPLSYADGYPRAFVFNRDNQFSLRLPVVDGMRERVVDVDFKLIEEKVAEALKQK